MKFTQRIMLVLSLMAGLIGAQLSFAQVDDVTAPGHQIREGAGAPQMNWRELR